MQQDIFLPDFTERPYWLTSLPPLPEAQPAVPPPSADVVVVGAGLSGLAVAHDLAVAGRDVAVLEAGTPGEGASSRNAGMLGRNTKHSFLGLQAAAGLDAARAHFSDLGAVLHECLARIEAENLDCALQRNGRLMLAMTQRQLEGFKREYEARQAHTGEESVFLDRAAIGAEIGSESYVGGVVLPDNAAIHAGAYTRAFLCRAEAAGATVIGNCPARAVRRESTGFAVKIDQGVILARDVVICTNGYGGGLVPWARRRLIAMDSYIVATEPLLPAILAGLLPGNRSYMDGNQRPVSMRLSSDGTRLLFGSRTGECPGRLRRTAAMIHADMVKIFPQLRATRLANAWGGRCALTWDYFPHVGKHDGIHYCLGYNFSGMAMAPHLAGIVADELLGGRKSTSRFATRPFPRALWPARAFDSAATRQVIRYYGSRDRRRIARES